jgi:hypothetical protein
MTFTFNGPVVLVHGCGKKAGWEAKGGEKLGKLDSPRSLGKGRRDHDWLEKNDASVEFRVADN